MDLDSLINKFSLPSKEVLENELGSLHFDEDDDIIESLIKSLRDKISKYIQFMEDLLQPDSSLISLQESNTLSEMERDKLFSLFKKTVLIHRTYLKIYLRSDFEDKVSYFKKLFYEWQSLKDPLMIFANKAVDSWKDSDSEDNTRQNYFG